MAKKLIVFGTRPEFIKLLPVYMEIKRQSLENDFVFIFTGQHMDMTKDFFRYFDFKPDITFPEKNHNNSLGFSFAYIISGIQEAIEDIQRSGNIKMIIGQGDTTSCACAAMCAFFNEIPFGHIEAGLRTNNFKNPFPEEYFRRIISLTSTIHFAPTHKARENLLKEGISKGNIVLTGNTIVDTIEIIKSRISYEEKKSICNKFPDSPNNILITCHRRENQNDRFHILIDTIKLLANENPSFNFIWVSHPSPYIQNELTEKTFRVHSNVFVIPPVNLLEMYYLYGKTRVIITDSGGIQEEAPSFDIPVIVIRKYTERIESVDLGYSILPGNFKEDLVSSFDHLISMTPIKMTNPYGDGQAAQRIVDYLRLNV